jgi:hypothetical protein
MWLSAPLVVTLCGLLVAIVALLPSRIGDMTRWVPISTLVLVFALVLVFYSWRQHWLPLKTSQRPTLVLPLAEDQVLFLQRSAGARGQSSSIDEFQAMAFMYAIIEPAMVRQRITERYVPGRRTLAQQVTIEAHIPSRVMEHRTPYAPAHIQLEGSVDFGSSTRDLTLMGTFDEHQASQEGSTVLFPILTPPKGELINDLRVTGSDGALLPIMSYRQYLQLVARVMRTLMCVAYGADKLDETLHKAAIEAERFALSCIMRRGGSEPDNTGYGALRQLMTNKNVKNVAALNMAARLADKLASSYATVAAIPCPPDGHFVVTYERVVTPRMERPARGLIGKVKLALRLLLGARPIEITIDLDDAASCQSFHLVIDAQDGVYVGEQGSKDLIAYCSAHHEHSEEVKRRGKFTGNPPPYFRFLRRAGQRHAHFYTRFFPHPIRDLKDGDKIPSVWFRFYEVPPGSVFRAMIAAVAAMCLVWLVGFVTWRSSDGDPGTDVPAFLLIFPAIAAGLLGFEARPHHLLEGTLAARLSLLCTAVTSLAASALFMAYKSGLIARADDSYADDFQILWNGARSWSILLLISIVNAACIFYTYTRRGWMYWYLSKWRGDEYRGPVEH